MYAPQTSTEEKVVIICGVSCTGLAPCQVQLNYISESELKVIGVHTGDTSKTHVVGNTSENTGRKHPPSKFFERIIFLLDRVAIARIK